MLPRYQRRSRRVDEAILGLYLHGANGRRIKAALAPLLRGAPLGKDAVSRLVNRLADEFRQWQKRDPAALKIVYTWHDGWYPKVRIGRQRVRVPVPVNRGFKLHRRMLCFSTLACEMRNHSGCAAGVRRRWLQFLRSRRVPSGAASVTCLVRVCRKVEADCGSLTGRRGYPDA